MNINLNEREAFEKRHNAPSENEITQMLAHVGVPSLDELIDQTIPASIRLSNQLILAPALSEKDYLSQLKKIASKNKIAHSFIGQGYYNCVVPPVIQRNILENPGWYTAYTPYQAEIAQGRLEALINFQTMVSELTGMEIANASLLDEGTAAAEAITMLYGLRKGTRKSAGTIFIDQHVFPQTLEVVLGRAIPQEIGVEIGDISTVDLDREDIFGLFFQYPNDKGAVIDTTSIVAKAKEKGMLVAVASDLLALTLLDPPGKWGADVVIGTTQRLGVPMGFGGPHAAYFSTREEYRRSIPGRIIGVSMDAEGNKAYRMALQTREQHIKRERATSNICTAQVLLAVISSMYAVYHGPNGLQAIALRIHAMAQAASQALARLGVINQNKSFFDTLSLSFPDVRKLKEIAARESVNLRYLADGTIGISFDETHDASDVQRVITVFAEALGKQTIAIDTHAPIAFERIRNQDFLQHPVFQSYHAEHEMLRYIRRLENKDLSLVHSMISLGSCTMKLNATTEMLPIT
ncbi:MAG: glycine dehydrogenase (aminomethyl-transferring), partial [Cyclobacteriaceae bacterium]|nr:glycine dehydrogenase (aminomethyl-transferring) [Cyclobacteriaceae bacterium]